MRCWLVPMIIPGVLVAPPVGWGHVHAGWDGSSQSRAADVLVGPMPCCQPVYQGAVEQFGWLTARR